MTPCNIKHVDQVKNQLEDAKQWAGVRDVDLVVRGKDNNIRLEARSRDKGNAKAKGLLQELIASINTQFSISGDLVEKMSKITNGYTTNVNFTQKALDELEQIAQRNVGEDVKKDSEITPKKIERVFSNNRGSTIAMKEGNDSLQEPLFDKDDSTINNLTGNLKSPFYNSQKEYYLANSSKGLLENIVKFTKDEDTKALAAALLQVKNIDAIPLKVTKYDKNTGDRGFLESNRGVLGTYNSFTELVSIIGTLDKDTFETVFLHEMVHAVTVNEYYSNKEFSDKINNLYNYALKFKNYRTSKGVELGDMYGMTNPKEFMAEAMSNPDFILELSKYYSPSQEKLKDKNIFQEFIDIVVNIIKIKIENKGKKYIDNNLGTNVLNVIGNYSNIPYRKFRSTQRYEQQKQIKPGVEELFESNPELASIGTQEQYSQYLDTIFPDSKVKDIVYHGTDVNIDKFDKNFRGKNTGDSGFTDGTPIDSSNAFFFSSNINSTFQYSFIKQLEKIASIANVLNNLIFNYTASNAAKVRKVDENLANHLREKQAELVTEVKMKEYLNTLYNKYYNANKELGVGFLNQYNNLYDSRKGVKNLKNNKNNILNGNYKNNDYVYVYNDIGDSYVSIDRDGKILSFNKEINQKNITDITSEQFDDIIKKGEENTSKFFQKVEGYKKKYKLTPNTYSVVINVQNPTIKDFNGIPFVQQINNTDSAVYEASKLTQQAVKDGKDSVIFKNIKDPYLADNYGIFESEQIHILGSKQDIEGFKEFTKNNSQTFYNLNKLDAKRKATNNTLNGILSRALSNLSVETIDENGVVTNKAIEVKSLEAFKNWYENNPKYKGEKFTQIGAALLLDGVLAATKDDGVTFAEEHLHFIVEVIKDTPEVQELLTATNEYGFRLFETTQVYQDNYRKYTEQYKGQPDVKNKVDKEILAKLIAQYMYDKRALDGIRNRLKRLLDRVIRIFYKSAKGWAKKLDDSMYPIEIRKALNLIDNNLEHSKYISDTKQHVIKYDPSKIEGVKANPSDNLTDIRTQLENMKKRLDQIIKSAPVAGKDWTRYKELFNRTVIKSAEDNVSELSLERIAEFKKEVEEALVLDPGNPELQQKIVDTQELEKLFNTFDKNRQDVFQLYNIEARISKINKSIALKQYEEGLNFFLFGTGNMKGASDPDTYDYNQYGAIFDLYKAFSKVIGFTGVPGESTVDSKNTLLSMVRPEHIAEMKELFDSYAPILHIVENYYIENGNKLFDGDDIRNAKVAEALKLSNMYIDTIRDFIDNNEVHQHARNNVEIENFRFIGREDLISDITSKSGAKIYTDLSMMKKVMGLYQHASEAWLRKFQLKINSLEEKENELNYQDSNNLYNSLVALGYKTLKGSKIREVFYQLDSKGNSTHYLNTERDIAKWNKDKTEFTKEIPRLLQNYVKNMGYSVYVPNTYEELMKIFTPIYTLKKEDKASLPKELTELWKVRDHYSELWGAWHESNTEEFTQDEADAFLAEAKNKLSLYHYKKLQESSIKEYTKLDGTTVTYFSGALTRPKAMNANYFNLNKQERAMADLFVKTVSDKKLQDNPEKYTFEWLARAPQISATMMDTFTGGGKRKVIKDKLAGIFSPRLDDDFYNVDGQGNVIKLPPERYNKKLDDPKLLTNDIIRSFAIYSANINHRKIFIPELMELQGMVDMVSTGQVTTSPYAFSLKNSLTTKSGKGSTLESAMNNLMDTVVYKNTTDKTPYSTFLIAVKKYITSLNLAYNMPSFITSWISGEIDKGVAAKIGDNYGTWEYMTGQKKYAKDLPSIMKDFENPTKKTVLGALSVAMGVGNSTVDNFSLTTTSKGIRMAISSVAPFSGWNATELLQSLPLLATSAETIRQVDGVWYTKPSYENKFFKIPVGTTDKKKFIEDQKKKWREGKSFIDTIKVDNGNITFQDVPENIVNLYFLRTRAIISEMSQQYTSDTYKGSLHTDSISNLLGTHSTWLMLTMDKMFGAKIDNYLTGQTQSGYYTKETLRYLKNIMLQGSRELYHSLKNSSLDVPTVKYMMNPDINFENRHNIRSVKRIGLHFGVIIAASAAMYIFAGLALGDDDDEELSVALQLASLLLTKVGIEQKAKLSVNDIYEIANNPLAHLEGSFKRFQVLDALWSVLSKNEEDWEAYTQDGPYKGMPKWSVSLAKSTPYFKGIFENYAAWYLNPMLGGSLTGDVSEQARSFRQKSAALKKYVVEPTTVGEVRNIAGDFPFALPAKIIGNTIGENALQLLGEPYYKNSSIFNMKLPSKKAAEINK
jgi:hypothetical protein